MARSSGRGHQRPRPSGAPGGGQSGGSRGGPVAGRRASAPPPAGSLRRRVERASAPLLVAMSRLPRLLVPALVGVLVLTALGAPAWAGLPALALVLLFVAWLTFLSWPVIPTSGRLLRVVLLVLLAAISLRMLHL